MADAREKAAEHQADLHVQDHHKDIAVHPEHLGMQQSDSRTRAKHKYKMRELPARTDDLKHSFVNRTITQWNCLPASVAEADSAVACKNWLAALLD